MNGDLIHLPMWNMQVVLVCKNEKHSLKQAASQPMVLNQWDVFGPNAPCQTSKHTHTHTHQTGVYYTLSPFIVVISFAFQTNGAARVATSWTQVGHMGTNKCLRLHRTRSAIWHSLDAQSVRDLGGPNNQHTFNRIVEMSLVLWQIEKHFNNWTALSYLKMMVLLYFFRDSSTT